jgi:hypothetical protein
MKCVNCGGPVGSEKWGYHKGMACSQECLDQIVAREGMVCDFCGDVDPIAEYPCANFTAVAGFFDKDFRHRGEQTMRYSEAWTACDGCATLIDADDVEGLVERAWQSNRPAMYLTPVKETELRYTLDRLIRAFWEYRQPGGRRALELR